MKIVLPTKHAAALLALLALALPAFVLAEGAAAGGVAGKAAFERMKKLAGDWKSADTGSGTAVRYQVTSAGNAVMETLLPGSHEEMVSMYYLDGGNLVMTHYCSAGNQPHMRLDAANSTADALVFAFDGGTNFDPAKDGHIHSAKIAWKGDRLESEWNFYQGGKEVNTKKFQLSRQ
ncbi:MAG TPA: hypothetical protein VOA87_23190 [Thermoanaerobaculia bacterium]|nr:hypothetical protein [Thermoanaerobaculia bacterium]